MSVSGITSGLTLLLVNAYLANLDILQQIKKYTDCHLKGFVDICLSQVAKSAAGIKI